MKIQRFIFLASFGIAFSALAGCKGIEVMKAEEIYKTRSLITLDSILCNGDRYGDYTGYQRTCRMADDYVHCFWFEPCIFKYSGINKFSAWTNDENLAVSEACRAQHPVIDDLSLALSSGEEIVTQKKWIGKANYKKMKFLRSNNEPLTKSLKPMTPGTCQGTEYIIKYVADYKLDPIGIEQVPFWHSGKPRGVDVKASEIIEELHSEKNEDPKNSQKK